MRIGNSDGRGATPLVALGRPGQVNKWILDPRSIEPIMLEVLNQHFRFVGSKTAADFGCITKAG
jgi:hypothetical protein